jgi:hypothetical protein
LVSDYITQLAEQIRDDVPPNVRPGEEDELHLFRLYALLALSKGLSTVREDIHNAWVIWMIQVHPGHPAILPFDQLTPEQRLQDDPFLKAVHKIAARLTDDRRHPQYSDDPTHEVK